MRLQSGIDLCKTTSIIRILLFAAVRYCILSNTNHVLHNWWTPGSNERPCLDKLLCITVAWSQSWLVLIGRRRLILTAHSICWWTVDFPQTCPTRNRQNETLRFHQNCTVNLWNAEWLPLSWTRFDGIGFRDKYTTPTCGLGMGVGRYGDYSECATGGSRWPTLLFGILLVKCSDVDLNVDVIQGLQTSRLDDWCVCVYVYLCTHTRTHHTPTYTYHL